MTTYRATLTRDLTQADVGAFTYSAIRNEYCPRLSGAGAYRKGERVTFRKAAEFGWYTVVFADGDVIRVREDAAIDCMRSDRDRLGRLQPATQIAAMNFDGAILSMRAGRKLVYHGD